MRTLIRKLRYLINGNQNSPAQAEEIVAVTDSQFEAYSRVIGSLISYFNELTIEGKKQFVHRVHHFKSAKKFHFIGMEKNDVSTTLISASAVQVTFGLKNYLLSHFEN